jgi:hypothetical protein
MALGLSIGFAKAARMTPTASTERVARNKSLAVVREIGARKMDWKSRAGNNT